MRKIARALISVSDKTGIVEFASELAKRDVELLSTGGTAATLRKAGLTVTDVSDFTGFPEMLDGRVKTLHPKVHGGLLALRDNREHQAAVYTHGINYIDLVVVNLYPFRETLAKPTADHNEIIENIDIGGPAMIRSAAKNYQDVVVVVSPIDYQPLLVELAELSGEISAATRQRLAGQAYAHTASYDLAISGYFAKINGQMPVELGRVGESGMPEQIILNLTRRQPLRYGENPHQPAALYLDSLRPEQGIATALQLQGKELSYNNLIDLDAAWQLVCEFDQTTCVIIKHTNPCGAAYGETARQAFELARATDPVSAFGGIIAFNTTLDEEAARSLSDLFVEAIIAPNFSESARTILVSKKNLRLITLKEKTEPSQERKTLNSFETKRVSGGYLVQGRDQLSLNREQVQIVTTKSPSETEWQSLDFAWKICKHVKSNAIVYANHGQLVGVGAGQMSRVDSVKFGALKAQLPLTGTVLASDAFFPFRDGLDEAAKHGITAVIQPGGSVRDAEVIAAANEHGLAMVFTGARHFKH